METLTTNNQSDVTRQAIPAEGGHWYHRDGRPCYEVPKANGEGTRPTTLADARKLNLVPSVTTILQCAAKPGLEAWKNQQLVQAALTLPKLPDETLDAYAERVIEDSKAQGLKARERGTELHAAIEQFIRVEPYDLHWRDHIHELLGALQQLGITLQSGNAERSFASDQGYGGKIDFSHDSRLLIDFKTTQKITSKTKPYDEHLMQCSAYGYGLFIPFGCGFSIPQFRALNAFIGVDDKEVRVFEHSWEDLERGWKMFSALLTYWRLSKNWKGEAQPT